MEEVEKNKKSKLKYFLIYTICFGFLFIICFLVYFFKHKKNFFGYIDGINQHYLIFLYIGKWLREIFKGIFITHTGIPLWNIGIGYGADILTSNGGYIPDLFNWLSVFFPEKFSEFGFNFTVVLKFYITGLAFSYYGFYKKQPAWAVLVGSIIYTFSGVMYVAFSEPFFMNPMYIFPFVMVGVEKLLKENKPALYIISLSYMFINYFYFAYMTAILVVIYYILSFIFDKDIENKSLKNFFKTGIKFFLYSLLAMGISALFLLPILLVITKIGRLDINYYLPVLYEKWYYKCFIAGMADSFYMPRNCFIGFGAISIPCIILLFLQKKKNTKLKVEFILATIRTLYSICWKSF